MNTNCLAGLACPRCGHDRDFHIMCQITIRLTDNGIDDDYAFKYGDGFEWDDDSPIKCPACHHRATVNAFTLPAHRDPRRTPTTQGHP